MMQQPYMGLQPRPFAGLPPQPPLPAVSLGAPVSMPPAQYPPAVQTPPDLTRGHFPPPMMQPVQLGSVSRNPFASHNLAAAPQASYSVPQHVVMQPASSSDVLGHQMRSSGVVHPHQKAGPGVGVLPPSSAGAAAAGTTGTMRAATAGTSFSGGATSSTAPNAREPSSVVKRRNYDADVRRLEARVAELEMENGEQAREIEYLRRVVEDYEAAGGVVSAASQGQGHQQQGGARKQPSQVHVGMYGAAGGAMQTQMQYEANNSSRYSQMSTSSRSTKQTNVSRFYASTKPVVPYTPLDTRDPVDNRLAEFYNSTGSAVPFVRINKGFYKYGHSLVELEIVNHKLMAKTETASVNHKLMVKTEDGWNRGKFGAIEKFMSAYEPLERDRLGLSVEE